MSPPEEAEERKKEEERIGVEEEAKPALPPPEEKRGVPVEKVHERISLPTAAEKTFLKRKPVRIGEAPPFHIDMRPRLIKLPPFEEKEKINVRYPLLPPYAYAHIYWDAKNNELVYHVEEPELSETEKDILRLLQLGLEEMINISFVRAKKSHLVIEYLEKNVQSILAELGTKVSGETYLKLMYYVYRNSVGLNQIEPLINDYYIEDIECNGIGYPIYVVHRIYQNMRTNVIFTALEEMTNFVEKLAQKAGRYVSYARPLLDGTLPDGSRVNAVYTEDVTTRGPTFTIRKFTKEPWTPVHLVTFKTASPEVFAYLWIAIEHKFNIMVIGETASGKTTFLNSIVNFVPPEARICSIEDTRELNLAHINWLPAVTRAGFGIPTAAGIQYGEITLFDLLRETFRQNPDYVVVGEVRGPEAYVLFQGMASIRGDEKIMVLNDGCPKRVAIKELKENVGYKAVTIDPKTEKVKILPVKAKIKHPPRKELYKITTKTGRVVTTTPDHSLFTYDRGIKEIAALSLKKGSTILVPAKLSCGYADLGCINLLQLPNIRVFAPEYIKAGVRKLGFDNASRICAIRSISDYYSNFIRSKPSSIKSSSFIKLMAKAKINYDLDKIKVKFLRKSKAFPAKLKLTKEFLKLLGYYIAEGSLNKSGKNSAICLYSKDKKILDDMRTCIKAVIGSSPRERVTNRGYGVATELNFAHKVLFELLLATCGKGAAKKAIPDFIFGLSKRRIGYFLSALYSGDGAFTDNYFGYYTISKQLASDLLQLLLVYGIVARVRERNRPGRKSTDYEILFYRANEKRKFLKYIKLLTKIPVPAKIGSPNPNIKNDVYLDKIRSIEKITLKQPEPVYDISVPGTQNFVGGFGGILLHNSGHPSFATFHAASVDTLVRRLETPPLNLPASLVETLDVVCVTTHIKTAARNVRRMTQLDEIISVGEAGKVEMNRLFIWDPIKDVFTFSRESVVFKKISERTGLSHEELLKELDLRVKFLNKMAELGITHFKAVTEMFNLYYKNKAQALKKLGL